MHEVESLTVRAFEDRMRPTHIQFVPAHVRNFQVSRPETPHDPRQDAKPLDARRLLRPLEQHLQTHAHTQEWGSSLENVAARDIHPALFELPHAVSERSNPGKYDSIRVYNPFRIRRQINLRTNLLQRARHG